MAVPPNLRPGTFYSEKLNETYDGYPFEAVADYTDPATSEILVKSGDQGKITKIGPNGRWALVAFKASNKPNATIPCSCFVVGTVRKFGNYNIITDIPSSIPSHIRGGTNHPNSVVLDTIAALVDAFNHTQLADVITGGIKTKIADNTSRQNIKTTLQNIITPEALQVFSKPNFTIEDIRSLPQVHSNGTARGIYIIVLPDGSVYIGYSGRGFLLRMYGHNTDMAGNFPSKTPKVLALRRMKSFTMHILAVFTGTESIETETLAEQVFICLTQSYCESLILPSNGDVSSEIMDQALDNHTFQHTATTISRIAEDTFVRTGWKGFVRRSSSGAQRGLNVQSPICTGPHARMLWMKTILPKQTVFRRAAVTAQDRGPNAIQTLLLGLTSIRRFYRFTCDKDPSRGLDVGTTIIPVFEVMNSDEPHPQAWARLPEIGCWNDWQLARRVAFRIEWQDVGTGQWWKQYQFISSWRDPNPVRESGELPPYLCAAMLWRYLMQCGKEEYRDWEYVKQPAMVREIRIDHLRQEITIQNVRPSQQKLQRSRMYTDSEIAQQMVACGAKNVDGPFGDFGSEAKSSGRTKCDTCFGHHGVKCAPFGNSNQCKPCFIVGHPCSWTADRELSVGSRLSLALGLRPLELCDTQCYPIPPRTALETVHSE